MLISTIEINKTSKKEKTPLSDQEQEDLLRYNAELNNSLYGQNHLVVDGSSEKRDGIVVEGGESELSDVETFDEKEEDAIITNIGARGALGEVGVNTEEMRKSGSYLRQEVSEMEMVDAVTGKEQTETQAGDIDAYGKNTMRVAIETNEVLSTAGGGSIGSVDVATRTATEMIEQEVVDGHGDGELLSHDRAVKAKNALIGRRYTELYMSGEVELFNKFPEEVAEKLKTDISNVVNRYGSFEGAPSEVLALIGERVVLASTIQSSPGEKKADLLIIDSDAEEEAVNSEKAVAQTADEMAVQIIEGDEKLIKEITKKIPDPKLKQEVEGYIDVLKVFYKSGVAGSTDKERIRLQEYLVEAFKDQ